MGGVLEYSAGEGNYPVINGIAQVPLRELEMLESDRKFLDALCAAGVDNWEGYDVALEMLDNDEEVVDDIPL